MSTASSEASTTPSNRSSRARPATVGPSSRRPSRSVRLVVETARKISPLPWCAVEPVRARPEPDPPGEPGAVGADDRGVGHDDADARTGRPGRVDLLRQRPSHWHAVDGQPFPLAEVGEQEHGHGVSLGGDAGRGTDAALEAQARHPGAGPDGPLGRRTGAAAGGKGSRVGGHHVVVLDLHPAAVVEEGVVTLPDHWDHHVVGDPVVALQLDPAGGVVDPAELHRRREVDRRLEHAPLTAGEEPGALAGAVEDGAPRGQRALVRVVSDDQRGHPGARDPASLRWRLLVAVERGVSEAHARHVDDGVRRPGREDADLDPDLT